MSSSTSIQQINQHNPLSLAWFFGLAVLLPLPALLFSRLVPAWAPQVALLALVVIFLLRSLAAGRLVGHTPVDGPLWLLLLLLPVGLQVTAEPRLTLPLTYAFLANLALFWAVAAQRETAWLRHSGWLLLAAGLGLSLIILVGTKFPGTKLPFVDPRFYGLLPARWQAFWDQESFNPNISGGLLALLWLPAVVLAWHGESWPQRDAARLVALLLAGVLLLTQSRGALLASLAGLLVITTLQHWRWWLVWALVLLFIGLVAYQVGPDRLLETILGRSELWGDRSFLGRQAIWAGSAALIRAFPVTGVGLGMIGPAFNQFYPNTAANINHAHNIYLQAGAELGLPGLGAYLALYLILLYRLGRRAVDRGAGPYRGLALGLLGSLVVLLTHGLVDAITASPQVALVVWGLMGLMVAVATAPRPDGAS